MIAQSLPINAHDRSDQNALNTARVLTAETDRLSLAIEHWLRDRYARSQSRYTEIIYRDTLNALRSYLRTMGMDLDSSFTVLAPAIETWAALRTASNTRKGRVAPSTYNQRIAAVSSFYKWTLEHGIYSEGNPVEQLKRAPVKKYARSQVLNAEQVRVKLQAIDRSTPRGLRDYMLLQVGLNTGRSAHELAALSRKSVVLTHGIVTLIFERCKGGKTMQDTLDVRLSKLFLFYLHTIYGVHLDDLAADTPIWISFSDRSQGQRIGSQTIADICEHHLGVSTINTLRHTFALAMDELGSHISTIQERLGHESLTTTSSYLRSLKKAHNPHAAALADSFGIAEHFSTHECLGERKSGERLLHSPYQTIEIGT